MLLSAKYIYQRYEGHYFWKIHLGAVAYSVFWSAWLAAGLNSFNLLSSTVNNCPFITLFAIILVLLEGLTSIDFTSSQHSVRVFGIFFLRLHRGDPWIWIVNKKTRKFYVFAKLDSKYIIHLQRLVKCGYI